MRVQAYEDQTRPGQGRAARHQTDSLRPIPDAALLNTLQRDYQAMLDGQMFYGETLVFDRIVERLVALEREISRWPGLRPASRH